MKWVGFILVLLISLTAARAQEQAEPAPSDPRNAHISAASADALASLFQQIEAYPLSEQTTIGTLLRQTQSQASMREELKKQAHQIGGPRWLDAQTAQVRMEIEGEIIAQSLRSILDKQPRTADVKPEQFEPALQALAKRQFTASGSSAPASVIEAVKPAGADEAWSKVDPQTRREAIAAARQRAAEQVINSARTVPLPDGRTLGTLIDTPGSPMRRELEQYLMERPVTAVRFRSDQQIEVTLSAPPAETFRRLRQSIEASEQSPSLNEAQWAALEETFVQAAAPATGVGQLPKQAPVLPRQISVRLPEQPPLWVREMIDAEGWAEGATTRLKTRHAAEQNAVAKLREQVLELPLTPELKLGDAVEQDPEIAAAVDRALARARAYKSDYFPDGRVLVRSSLDLRDVWQQLQER